MSLDSHKRRVSIDQRVPRHRSYHPRVVVVVDPRNVGPAVTAILARLADLQARHGTGAYLFIDTAMNAYVLTDEHTATQAWLREHFAWLVGFYSRTRKGVLPLLLPTPEGVTEDIGEHLRDLAA